MAQKGKSVEADIYETLGDGTARTKSPLLEAKIIAACFLRKPELQTICNSLTPEDFSDPRYRAFFSYIQKTYESGRLPDQDVCVTQAQRYTELDIEPEDYKAGLVSALENGADCDIEQVCHEIHDLYVVRKILALGTRISSNISDGKSSTELVGHAEEALKKLTGEVMRDNTLMTIDQVIESTPGGLDEIVDPPMDGIPSPWQTVNEYIYGFRPGQMVTIGARPGAGKSACLVQIAKHAANLGKIVVFFSLEMAAIDLWSRILCHEVGIKSQDLMHRQLTSQEKDRIKDYIRHAAPRNLLISDRGGRTPLSMRSELARIKARYGKVDMVCVDYIQLMESPMHANNRVNEVGSISRALKRMSMDFDTRMICAAQLNRLVDNRPGDDRPKLSDFRESGSLEQDSDICLLLHRPSTTKKPKEGVPPPPDEFIIAKQRRGKTGIINMKYVGDHYQFQEVL
jgi:replicative DNA helicase